jgi:hypothetical protein
MVNKIEKDLDHALKVFPSLSKIKEGRIFILKGMIPIIDKDGCRRTSFEISIEFGISFPKRFPIVREIGNRIPKTPDRHIYTDTGALCLAVPPKEILICERGINTLRFLNEILVPHLAMQAYREIDEEYPIGEFSHGNAGIKEFFLELFNTQNQALVAEGIEFALSKKIPNRNVLCFCNSSKKIKDCHLDAMKDLYSIGKDYLKNIHNLFK